MTNLVERQRLPCFLGYLLFVFLPFARAVLVNSTIDDSFPDPRTGQAIAYTPEGSWTDGKDCGDCSARPDEQSLYRGTWHQAIKLANASASQLPSASIAFTGTAIYVFCVLPRTTSNPAGQTDLRFLVDNQVAGTYEKTPEGTEGYAYDVLVFSKQGLANQQHFFVLQVGREGGPEATVLLDKIIYSYDDGKMSPGTLGALVGGVLAGVAVLGGLLAFLYRYYTKRRKNRAPNQQPEASDSGSIEYPLVVPFTHTAAEWNQNQAISGGGLSPSDSYPTSPTSTRSKHTQPSSQPSQHQPNSYYGYSPDQVDIYDPYNNRVSFSSNPTTTTYIGPSSSSGTASATANTETPPPYAPETIPLKPRKKSATKSSSPTTTPRKE